MANENAVVCRQGAMRWRLAEWGTGLLVTQCYQYVKGTTMEDFEDSTSNFDSSLTSS